MARNSESGRSGLHNAFFAFGRCQIPFCRLFCPLLLILLHGPHPAASGSPSSMQLVDQQSSQACEEEEKRGTNEQSTRQKKLVHEREGRDAAALEEEENEKRTHTEPVTDKFVSSCLTAAVLL